jgi:CubicO group peptidase (beta-lactamase class C family)
VLPTTDPSQAGIDAQGILDLLDGAAHLDLHSIAIARRGQAVARGWWAPYGPDRKHLLYSCSKSITATTVAALVGDGAFSFDDPVLDLLPPDVLGGAGDIAEVWRRVTVRHCLTMTVGHTYDAWPGRAAYDGELLHTILADPPDGEPGAVFAYNQVATYLLSRAVSHVTGRTLDEVAMTRVLSRLGIPEIEWERDRDGNPLGFTGARLRTDDLLALTQLWLGHGEVDGEQIVPASWFDEATRAALPVADAASASDWEHGYGHSFWIARHGYRADGAYGQYGLVLPEQQLTVAITSELEVMQELLDLVWQHLLPAVDRPGSAETDARLAERLATLEIPPLASSAPAGEHRSRATDPASDLDPAYSAAAVSDDGGTLTFTRHGAEVSIAVGDGSWAASELVAEGRHLPVVASGGWTTTGYQAVVRVIETPHTFHVDTGPAGALLRWRRAPLRSSDPLHQAVR